VRIPSRVSGITFAQFDALNSRAAELRAAGHHVIALGQAIPGFPPPPAAIRAAQNALAAGTAHVYSADAGLPSLRAALCARLRETHDIVATPDEVIITSGGNQAFMLAMMTLVDPGDEVLLPAPYFVNHEMTVRAIGAVPVEVPLNESRGFALGWDDLEPHVSSSTRAVVVCTPSNPTGAVVEREEMVRIARELATRGVLLFADETYGRFVYGREFWSVAALPEWRENVILTGTFSKSFGMTGWRVGYLLADTGVTSQAIKIQDAMVICAPVLSQVAAEAALRESWDYPLSFHDQLIARRRVLVDGLQTIPRLHWTPTAGAFFAFVRVDACTDSNQLALDILERAHVVTIPGASFGRSGEGFIRLSYGAATEDELREAVARLKQYFAYP
jgi:aminotransferase